MKATASTGPRRAPRSSTPVSGADTEAAFIAAATRLFAEKGFKGTSIADLARELNLTTASLYYYVDGKQDLLARVLQSGMADFLARLQAIVDGPGDPREKLELAVGNHIDFVIHRTDVVRIFLRYRSMLHDQPRQHYQQMLDRYQLLFTQVLQSAGAAASEDTDPVLLRQAVLGMINSMIEWYRPDGRLSAEEINRQLTRVIVDRLLRPA